MWRAGHCLQCCVATPRRFATLHTGIAFAGRSGSIPGNRRWRRKMAVKSIPDGYHSLTPYLIVADGAAAIAFYQQAFEAKVRMRLPRPHGRIAHAELRIGDSLVMLADEAPQMGARAPSTVGGTPVSLHLYIEDVDAVVARALAADAKLLHPVE